MLSKKMNKMLNEQVQKEMFSSYLYLAMKAYFMDKSLDGFTNFFDIQVQEENFHAKKMYEYISRVGGEIDLLAIDKPSMEYDSPLDVFKKTFAHEQFITKSIYELVDNAIAEGDHKTTAFLQWYVDEQVEEEETMDGIVKKLALIGDDSSALLKLDDELITRVFTPPVA